MKLRAFLLAAATAVTGIALGAQGSDARGGPSSIQPAVLKEWLSYIASDELQGREVYTEGLGLAASFIAEHLKQWGVKPGADDGDYFQTIKVVGVKNASHSSVVVDVNGEIRMFKDGEGFTLPRNMGGPQTVTGDDIRFVGYGLQIPSRPAGRLRRGSTRRGRSSSGSAPSGPQNTGSDGFARAARRERDRQSTRGRSR